MDADGYRPGEYGSLTPNPEGEKEEKRKKSKRTVIALAGLAALLAAGGCCVGSGLVQKIIPQREEETVVVVEPADDVYVAPTSVPTGAPTLAPTPVPRDEGWFGTYEGTAEGRRESEYRGTRDIDEFFQGDELLWVEIMNQEDCYALLYCNEERNWGVDIMFRGPTAAESFVNLRIYLPDDPSDAPNLTLTDDTITITPTDEHPYEIILERAGDHLEGHLRTEGIPTPIGNATEWWTVDYLIADRTTAPDPAFR